MTCEEAMDLYCSLDQGEPLPAELEDHISACSTCKQQVEQMEWVFQAYRREGLYPIPSPMEDRVLSAIEAMEATPNAQPQVTLSPGKWMLPGIFILLGIMGVPFSTVFPVFSSFPAGNIELIVPFVLGAAFTVYAAFFTGYNLEWLKKKFFA